MVLGDAVVEEEAENYSKLLATRVLQGYQTSDALRCDLDQRLAIVRLQRVDSLRVHAYLSEIDRWKYGCRAYTDARNEATGIERR